MKSLRGYTKGFTTPQWGLLYVDRSPIHSCYFWIVVNMMKNYNKYILVTFLVSLTKTKNMTEKKNKYSFDEGGRWQRMARVVVVVVVENPQNWLT